MAAPAIDQIIGIISQLPLKEALGYLVAQKIFDFSGNGFSKIKEIIKDKYNKEKFAFVPNKEEALRLKRLFTDPSYNEIRSLIPNYRYIDLIRTGLLISNYHQNPTNEGKTRTKEIKQGILHRPNGSKLLKIANLPTTPFFSVILGFLHQLKIEESYSETQLQEQFEELVAEWEDASFFVKAENTVEQIKNFCKYNIEKQRNLIFLLGMKSAAKLVEDSLSELDSEGTLQSAGYLPELKKRKEGLNPRVEVTLVRKKIN